MITYKVEIQKRGQILCAHKACFLMPGHNYRFVGIGPQYYIHITHSITQITVKNCSRMVCICVCTYS